jgi:hypothetical protein
MSFFYVPFRLLKLRNTECSNNEEVGILWNGVIMAYRKALLHNLTGSAEENEIEYQNINVAAVTLCILVDTYISE